MTGLTLIRLGSGLGGVPRYARAERVKSWTTEIYGAHMIAGISAD
jgi:hypothetical protein